MRMWMIDPILMCDAHLNEEHSSIHQLQRHIRDGHKLDVILSGHVEPQNAHTRHDLLASEMVRRGHNHRSPVTASQLEVPSEFHKVVDRTASFIELMRSCYKCKQQMKAVL